MAERPFLATIEQSLVEGGVAVRVTIGMGESAFTGEAEGSADPTALSRLVGEATLRAVETLDSGAAYDLTAVGTTDLGPARVALAQVREVGRIDYLVGSALVRSGDVGTATAKAILDALNRRIAYEQMDQR